MSESPFSPRLEHAIELSSQWHDQTYRKGAWRDPAFELPSGESVRVPVTAHLMTTALTVQRAGWGEDAVAAAFLHDALEDVNRHNQRLMRKQLRQNVGEDVSRLVEAVTEKKHDDEGRPQSWRERKEGYLQGLSEAPAAAVAISLADKLHNLWTMNQSLEREVPIFEGTAGHAGLSAGPEEQHWFFRTVLKEAEGRDDDRLGNLTKNLEAEIARFEELSGLA